MIKLNQQLERLEIQSFEIENAVVFNYFDNQPADQREEKLLRAIYIGVLALMEDRISAFLSKTSNELGTELESLKLIFEMKKELFFKSSVKGILAEEEIADYLNTYFDQRHLKDRAILVRNTPGLLKGNKTGDIICELDGKNDETIVIECKFDKNIRLGDISKQDIFTKRTDTAWSQLIESQANRGSKISLIVFDVSIVDHTILTKIENVGYIPGIGFVVIVNSQKGDFSNLAIAYMLARDIAVNSQKLEFDKDLLAIIVNRVIKDLNEIFTIKTLVESNIENNKSILKQLEKSILLMEFNQHYLKKFLNDGTLTKTDLLNYYQGEDIKDKYKVIEREINNSI
ncbi:hypothetical protein [Mucilaginibacter sp. UR6-11]|uniref:hypothetical protein n=1 Tax=Mucilaginibacter sp. UR6-11 TaxID=1435644 RepID=UPI001E504B4C|nr:hypothetical protein [Mucilaginibacter sp. UR6-11]MCC8427087.1 hypothetical protein [Mucilaginibacter sp. UR6-11]